MQYLSKRALACWRGTIGETKPLRVDVLVHKVIEVLKGEDLR